MEVNLTVAESRHRKNRADLGPISVLCGLTNKTVDKQHTILVKAVIGSAVVPTVIAHRLPGFTGRSSNCSPH